MRRKLVISMILASSALFQSPAGLAADGPAATRPDAPAVDPAAVAALSKVATYLRGLQSFQVAADSTFDVILDDGRKVELDQAVEYKLQLPNRLFADIKSDRKQRQYFYDGKQLTVYAPRTKYYAAVPAPATVAGLLTKTSQLGVDFPLADLLVWGTNNISTAPITSASFVGPAHVGGQVCGQYIFRQNQLDWQVWIPASGPPLPCKLAITDTSDPTMPKYSARLTWQAQPELSEAAFQFTPPQDAQRIKLVAADSVTIVEQE